MYVFKILDLPDTEQRRVKRAHSSVPVSERIGHPLKPSRLNDPFWSNEQRNKVQRLMQFLQGNFPRNLNFVRNQEFIIPRKMNPDNAFPAERTTTPALPSTESPKFKLPTTFIPLFAFTSGPLAQSMYQPTEGSIHTAETTESPLLLPQERRNKSKNKTKNSEGSLRKMPFQHVDTSLVSPSGTLIMSVFNNFLVFQEKVSSSDGPSTTQTVMSTSERVDTPKEPSSTPSSIVTTTISPNPGTPAKAFVNIVRNVGEVFCKICESFGHQWKAMCEKKNCIVPTKPTSS